jgi:hypothetical protein
LEEGPLRDVTTWRHELAEAMTSNEDAGPVVAYAPDAAAFDVEFDPGYGGTEGPSVLAWTKAWVYFPVCYDGAEWMGSAPRDPVSAGQGHVGGG